MEGVLAILMIFGTPVMLGLIIAGGLLINSRIKRQHDEKQRQMLERIMLEKLDIIKTAVAMGYSRNELDALDRRLEQLIGTEKLQGLLRGDSVQLTSTELRSVELDTELQRLQAAKQETE